MLNFIEWRRALQSPVVGCRSLGTHVRLLVEQEQDVEILMKPE